MFKTKTNKELEATLASTSKEKEELEKKIEDLTSQLKEVKKEEEESDPPKEEEKDKSDPPKEEEKDKSVPPKEEGKSAPPKEEEDEKKAISDLTAAVAALSDNLETLKESIPEQVANLSNAQTIEKLASLGVSLELPTSDKEDLAAFRGLTSEEQNAVFRKTISNK